MRSGAIKRWVAAGVLAGGMLYTIPAMAAYNVYLTIQGSKQGKIKGEAERISLTGVTHDITMPTEHATGMASGKRQHGSITVTKTVDSASPKLFQAMKTNEVLSNVTIEFEGAAGAGAGKAARMIELKDAVISNIRVTGKSEAITIDYETVQVTYMNGNKSATDAWDAK
jgi:type VI secretion system secreted protein Hcp